MRRNVVITLLLSGLLLYGGLYPLHGWQWGNALGFLAERQPVHSGFDDVFVNIVVFVPLGFATALALSLGRRVAVAVGLAVIYGALISFAIEALQAFLPMRYSSLTDLITNTAGTAIGAVLAALFRRRHLAAPGDTRLRYYRDPLLRLAAVSHAAWALVQVWPLNPMVEHGALALRLAAVTMPPSLADPWSAGQAVVAGTSVLGLGLMWRALLPSSSDALLRICAALLMPVLARVLMGADGLSPEVFAGTLAGLALLWAVPRQPPPRLALIALALLALCFVVSEVLPGTRARFHTFNWIPFKAHLQNPLVGTEALLDAAWMAVALATCVMAALTLWRWWWVWGSTAIMVAAALILEHHQSLIPGRLPDVTLAIIMGLTSLLAFFSAHRAWIRRAPAT